MKYSEQFLPASQGEMRERGWDSADIVLVTGDAYVDHPSFGVALIGRWLEAHGYRVALLSQPAHQSSESFRIFGPPRLFWGITAGNLDSIVSNYSGNGKVRDHDNYSPDGNPYFGQIKDKRFRRRPDRATIRYAGLAKAAFPDVPVVLGGIEASLRRFVHFDYQQNKLRSSVLTDAKADLLVYGMGERAVLEIASRLKRGEKDLSGIPGTCIRVTDKKMDEQREHAATCRVLPSWGEICKDSGRFLEAEVTVDRHARAYSDSLLSQQQQSLWVVQHPPAAPLSTAELDRLYSLPFARREHPSSKNVPAYRMIRHSVAIVRGCSGNCSFCAITRHQGPVVTSRSEKSILDEVQKLSSAKDFKGTITDLGGPTANLYGAECGIKKCRRHDCLVGGTCPHLKLNEDAFLSLLKKVLQVPHVKHAYISSGLRMELLLKTPRLLERILRLHTPGAMKIAPEHTEDSVLRLMHKQPNVLPEFMKKCREIGDKAGKKFLLSPYFMSSHPGCTVKDMEALAAEIKKLGLDVRAFQDFTPTPGTISTAMYVSGLDRDTGKPLFVARQGRERQLQRQLLEKISKKKRTDTR